MRIHSLTVMALFAVMPAAFAENFATCLLDKLPGVRNDQATTAAWNLCRGQHPGTFGSVEQGSGLGIFADYDSGDECALDLAKETSDRRAGFLIARSCRLLYDEPAFEFDSSGAVLEEQPKGDLYDEYSIKPTPPPPPPPPAQPQSAPLTPEMVDALLGNPPSQPSCEIKPVMTDDEYRACGIAPPGQ